MAFLNEDTRTQLISKSKSSKKGKERFNRRTKSKVANTVKSFNQIDMNKLFKDDILTVNIPVQGETDNYIVRITFGGFLEILRDQIANKEKLDFRDICRACIIGFNKDDIFISCSCPDFNYRFRYWTTKNNINSGDPETRPSNITNPNDSLGSACKHILLILNNNSWIIKVASVINNYIKYMEKHYQKAYYDIMYPVIYGKEYEEPVQLSLDDSDELVSDEETIDISNEMGRKSGQFQKGNQQGIRFEKENTPDKNQIEIQETSEEEENEDDII